MWWLTPKISWITTTPPLGVPFGVARYAPISPAFDLRRISSPMRIPPGCGRHWTWYCGAVQPAAPPREPQKKIMYVPKHFEGDEPTGREIMQAHGWALLMTADADA